MVFGGVKLLEENGGFGRFFRDMKFIQGILGESLPTSNYNCLLKMKQTSPPCSSFLTGFGVTALLDAGTGGQDYKSLSFLAAPSLLDHVSTNFDRKKKCNPMSRETLMSNPC